MSSPTTTNVLIDVANERVRQDLRFGEQNHTDLAGSPWTQAHYYRFFAESAEMHKSFNDDPSREADWTGIFLEEVYEALAESDPEKIRAELIQAVAVGVAWIEAIDRRLSKGEK